MGEDKVLKVKIQASNYYLRFSCALCGISTRHDGFEAYIEDIGQICPQCRNGGPLEIRQGIKDKSKALFDELQRLKELMTCKIEWPADDELDAELSNRLKWDKEIRADVPKEKDSGSTDELYYRKQISRLKSFSR